MSGIMIYLVISYVIVVWGFLGAIFCMNFMSRATDKQFQLAVLLSGPLMWIIALMFKYATKKEIERYKRLGIKVEED